MIKEYKYNTNLGVGFGIIAQIAGSFLSKYGYLLFGNVLMFIGFILFIWGCVQYAKGKGYSGWLGLLGLLSIFGLLVLVLLRDKHK
jgi:TRAP-type C4-dicarboxylate transport system permease small subunit